jgi:ADP-heptose:LPS heptosyltransferase
MLARNPMRMDYQRKYEEIVADYNREKDRTTIEETFLRLVELVNSLDGHPIDWLCALMAEMNVPLPSNEPTLNVPSGILGTISERFYSCPRPWIVLGIGALHSEREWPDEYWVEFLAKLRHHSAGTRLSSTFVIEVDGFSEDWEIHSRGLSRDGKNPRHQIL